MAPPTPQAADPARARRAVERAIDEFRRGRPVAILGDDGAAVLALAAERVTEPAIDAVLSDRAAGALAITANRAAALHILPSGHDPVLLDLLPWMAADTLAGLADATTDFANPLRGPFQRRRQAPEPTEAAAVHLAKRARLLPAAIVAPLPRAPADWCARHDALAVEVAAIAGYEGAAARALRPVTAARVPLPGAEDSRIVAFRPIDGGIEHLAILIGAAPAGRPVLTRLHSECLTGDLLGSLKCDCGEQLRGAVEIIAKAGGGLILYLAQEGRGIGLMNKLRAYRLQEDGFDTVEANLRLGFDDDERLFRPAAEMLNHLGFTAIRLMSNNPAKVERLRGLGIDVVERVPHSFPPNAHNAGYLATKRSKSGHRL